MGPNVLSIRGPSTKEEHVSIFSAKQMSSGGRPAGSPVVCGPYSLLTLLMNEVDRR